MARFIAILTMQGLLPSPVEKKYWGENGYLTLKYFNEIMTYNRFILYKRLLHFSDSTDSQTLSSDEKNFREIKPVLEIQLAAKEIQLAVSSGTRNCSRRVSAQIARAFVIRTEDRH